MPVKDIIVTVTVRAVDAQGNTKQDDITQRIPKNGTLGVAIAPAGKTKIGDLVETLGNLLDKDQSDL